MKFHTPRIAPWLLACAITALSPGVMAKPAPKKQQQPAQTEAQRPLYSTRSDVMAQAEAIAQRTQLDTTWVRQALAQARYQPGVVKAILPPPVGMPKNWTVYRSRFIDRHRIQAGVKF
jgi:membrane-bound lytic murein transglycosylase B